MLLSGVAFGGCRVLTEQDLADWKNTHGAEETGAWDTGDSGEPVQDVTHGADDPPDPQGCDVALQKVGEGGSSATLPDDLPDTARQGNYPEDPEDPEDPMHIRGFRLARSP